MKIYKMIYWATTFLMAVLVITSIYLNILKFDDVAKFYERLSIPDWVIYPSAIIKIIALIAIFTRKSGMLKEWAYAGLFFNAVLAFSAHQIEQDGMGAYAFIAAMAIMTSRIFEEKVYPEPKTLSAVS